VTGSYREGYESGHEEGFNEGYEAGALDKPKDLAPNGLSAPGGPRELTQLISAEILASVGGRDARLEVQPDPSMRGDVRVSVRAASLPELVQVLAFLGTTVAGMEHNARAELARGPKV